MKEVNFELEKNGIKIIYPLDTFNVNEIATYVAKSLCGKFPELNLNYKTVFIDVSRIKMYIADMPASMSDACYFYKNSSIYFKKGLDFDKIKKLAFHECLHHFQEVKDSKGVLHRLGLCSYLGSRAYGNALNEASVQLMTSIATNEPHDTVKYYGVTLPTDSPNYYPLLCNLVKQVGYLTGFSVLFESTFFANDAFFEKFKTAIGEKNAYKVQQNLDKLLNYEEKVSSLNYKVQSEDLAYFRFKKATDGIANAKKNIQKLFLDTQNLIITSFFDSKVYNLKTANQIEEFRKCLYSFSNLIGSTSNYSFFNDYYIQKMSVLDDMYESISKNVSLSIVKKSKFFILFESLFSIFSKNSREYENNK